LAAPADEWVLADLQFAWSVSVVRMLIYAQMTLWRIGETPDLLPDPPN
jgi:hypothetical protein